MRSVRVRSKPSGCSTVSTSSRRWVAGPWKRTATGSDRERHGQHSRASRHGRGCGLIVASAAPPPPCQVDVHRSDGEDDEGPLSTSGTSSNAPCLPRAIRESSRGASRAWPRPWLRRSTRSYSRCWLGVRRS
jgi:hypothetical protein